MSTLILILVWLIWKGVYSSDETKTPTENNLAYINPDSPMHNWKFSELDGETIFPWKTVFANKYFPVYMEHLILCPKCLRENRMKISGDEFNFIPPNYLGENILTVHYKTPDYTWKNSYGQEGHLSICLKHKRQIDFDNTMMN